MQRSCYNIKGLIFFSSWIIFVQNVHFWSRWHLYSYFSCFLDIHQDKPQRSLISITIYNRRVSQVALVVKHPPANAGDIRNMGSIPGSGKTPRGGHGNPLQYSCLENPMDRGTWQAVVHRITKSQTQPKWLSMQAHTDNSQSHNKTPGSDKSFQSLQF